MMVSADALTEIFLELTRRPSPSRAERPVADFVHDFLRGLGLETVEDATGEAIGGNAGNIVCRVPGSDGGDPAVVLGAHLDTVPIGGDLRPVLEEGVFRNAAGGILGADDKSAITALMHATALLVESNLPHPSYELLFTVSEETALTGVKHLDLTGLKSPMGMVLDSAGPVGGITVAAPSQNTVRATFRGKAAHAGVEPEKGRSAIWAAGKALGRMSLGRLDHETTANVGLIRGGTARNIVPEECFVEAETRSHDDAKLADATSALVDALHLGAGEVGTDLQLEVVTEYRRYRLGSRTAVVRLAKAAAEEVGITPRLQVAGGGADANILNERGLPTVNLTTGMWGIHSAGESLALKDLVKLTELVMEVVRLAPSFVSRRGRKAG